jgi:hypothetical protein
MRQDGGGALLTIGWLILAAYLIVVLVFSLALGGLRMARSLKRARSWTPLVIMASGTALIFLTLVWRNRGLLYGASAVLLLSSAWGILANRQEVDQA